MIQINSTLTNQLIAGFLAIFLSSCSTLPPQTDSLSYQYDVVVHRDFWGIPYIKGTTDADVAFGIGLSHAEDAYDDLIELMPLYRGNSALFNGLEGAETDYIVRLLRVHENVEKFAKNQLSEKSLKMAQAYADGVNQFAIDHPNQVNKKLHPITKEDVIAGSYIQHLFFAGLDSGLQSISDHISKSIPTGSNAIAVNGSKTKDNSSFLLINSHQPLAGPVGWYELNVESQSGWSAHGGNFPGSFVVNVGFNKNIGWGATVNRPDVLDIFELTINPMNSNEYLLDGTWVPFDVEEDYLQIKILGFLKIKSKQNFKYSQFGPVLEIEDRFFALRHSTQNSFQEIDGWFALNEANSVHEFKSALDSRKIPSFNFVVMDSSKNIGFFYNGRIPSRQNAKAARNILQSTSSKDIWPLNKSIEILPTFINPVNGWVQSTNQNPYAVMGKYSAALDPNSSNVYFEQRLTNRSFVANELLSTKNKIGLDDFIDIKFDHSYSKDSRQYQYLLNLAEENQEIAGKVELWNRKTDFTNKHAGYNSCLMAHEWLSEMNAKPIPKTEDVLSKCKGWFDKINREQNDEWGKITTISRLGKSYPIQGSVDTLRAVYGTPNAKTKSIDMSGGDGLFYIIEEGGNGRMIYGMHNFGSSRNRSSVHYSDQTFLFSREALRFVPESL
jgi:penicillin amidase/acyl-homoserine-lactone acylase